MMRSNEDGVIPMAQELPRRDKCSRLVMPSNEDGAIPMDLPGRRPANARTHALSQSQRQRGEAAHGESAHNKGVNSLNSQFGNLRHINRFHWGLTSLPTPRTTQMPLVNTKTFGTLAPDCAFAVGAAAALALDPLSALLWGSACERAESAHISEIQIERASHRAL